jgi:hypothetical protein
MVADVNKCELMGAVDRSKLQVAKKVVPLLVDVIGSCGL